MENQVSKSRRSVPEAPGLICGIFVSKSNIFTKGILFHERSKKALLLHFEFEVISGLGRGLRIGRDFVLYQKCPMLETPVFSRFFGHRKNLTTDRMFYQS